MNINLTLSGPTLENLSIKIHHKTNKSSTFVYQETNRHGRKEKKGGIGYPATPVEGGVGGAGDEAVGVEERADAAESNADGHRRRDAGPAGRRLPAAQAGAHQGGLAPAGHLPP